MAGLYVHIPFCHSKCAYCDFFSTPGWGDTGRYVDSVLRELDERKDEIEENFSTIYIGGGTPSLLPQDELKHLIDSLPSEGIKEFTIEVNPEDVTESLMGFLSDSPVNRISMGVQSLIDRELAFIGRRHTAKEALDAIDMIQRHRLELSCDLIYGLPYQTEATWRHSLQTLLERDIPHLSAYLLSYEPGTRLFAMKQTGKVKEADEETVSGMYSLLCSLAATKGYDHYEISNFAKPGHHAVHNSNYWNYSPYLGLGVSAHSFDGTVRRHNPIKIADYIALRTSPFFSVEEESDIERQNEYVLVSLRTARGIMLEECRQRFGDKVAERILSTARRHLGSGNMTLNDGRLRIAEESWLISDTIILDFIETE